MKYYSITALIFEKGAVSNSVIVLYKTDNRASISDFRNFVAHKFASSVDPNSTIIIVNWQEIDKNTYDIIEKQKVAAETVK